jgi:signal peptidase I
METTTETTTEETTEKEKKKGTFWKDIADMLEAVLISVFCVIMIFAYVLRPVTVEGHSMESTLQDQDKLFMTDLFYTPERGDIVIVDNDVSHLYDENGNLVEGAGLSTETTEKRLIKRVIAMGGETLDIDFTTGTVTIDGEPLEESYINNLTLNDEGAFTYPLTIPEGYYFVMGDNRQHSSDSRHPLVGLVSADQILGKAVFRFAPFSSIGSIYD